METHYIMTIYGFNIIKNSFRKKRLVPEILLEMKSTFIDIEVEAKRTKPRVTVHKSKRIP